MKIYTKKGDRGKTQLLGGTTVSKDNMQLECYGSIDELNAFIGHIYERKDLDQKNQKILMKIQNQLFNIGSNLANDNTKKINLPDITEENILEIEKAIDRMDKILPELKNFILPSGSETATRCHIARTVCRRTERKLISLTNQQPVKPIYTKYLNRLSDYLFILSRFSLHLNNVKEVYWQK